MPVRDEKHRTLLDALGRMGSAGRAEGEDESQFPLTFYPVAEHLRGFDPDVVLVVGPRGAGKTELFRAVIQKNLLPAAARLVKGLRLPPLEPNRTRWVQGFPSGKDFPDRLTLKDFAKKKNASHEPFLELWFAYLVRILRRENEIGNRQELSELLSPTGASVGEVHSAFKRLHQPAVEALDSLDARLEKEDGWIFIGYDELDTIVGGQWDATNAIVQGLVAFWASYTRRWRRIRAKIFLRSDLYQRVGGKGGADLAKLAANRVEIAWSDRNLYSMLIKRIVNAAEELREYCSTVKLSSEKDQDLGYVPSLDKSEDAKPLINKMIGPYMGESAKKGLTFRWLLDHIRDGRGQALPRPLVGLVEVAASTQRDLPSRPAPPRLIEPKSLRRALDRISRDHVDQTLEEWPWLADLRSSIGGQEVPWNRPEIEYLLDRKYPDRATAPELTPGELVEYLIEVGVFRRRADGRIDAPDLFLAGLNLKRKGGVLRK